MSWVWLTKSALFLVGCSLAALLALGIFMVVAAERETKIIFLSVGQGDAILITHGRQQILIDGGREGRVLLDRVGRHIPFFDRTIEVVIPTHPDADHIGGLPKLFRQYRVKTMLASGARSETDTVRLLERDIERAFRGEALSAIAGTVIDIPTGGSLEIVFPRHPLPSNTGETNAGSVVTRFSFGDMSFLLMGDLPDEEQYLPGIAPATILKVAHHGARSSTSETWLDLVRPREAILSVGENNYGHPAEEVLARLARRGIAILRTDESGDIVYRCRAEWGSCRRD